MGLWVHPDYWADGYAAEIQHLGSTLAFDAAGMPGLSARAMQQNTKALKTFVRQGVTRVGEVLIPRKGGNPAPGYAYRICAEDWRGMAAANAPMLVR